MQGGCEPHTQPINSNTLHTHPVVTHVDGDQGGVGGKRLRDGTGDVVVARNHMHQVWCVANALWQRPRECIAGQIEHKDVAQVANGRGDAPGELVGGGGKPCQGGVGGKDIRDAARQLVEACG